MLPIVWFYIALVVVSWMVLAYVEMRRRARKSIRECPGLKVISRARLNSLMVIEPDLRIIEIYDSTNSARDGLQPSPRIAGAVSTSLSRLQALLASWEPGKILVFSRGEGSSFQWIEVDSILYRLGLHEAFVLESRIRPWNARLPIVSGTVGTAGAPIEKRH